MFKNINKASSSSSDDDSSSSEDEAPVKATRNKKLRKAFPQFVNPIKFDVPETSKKTNTKLEGIEAKSVVLQPGFEQKMGLPLTNQSRKELKRQRREEREKSTGKKWFDLPATELTEERKRDLEVLQLRGSLDPKRFYRNNDRPVLPKFFQVGTIVEDKADFYSSRVPKKQRKKTIVDELLADAELKQYSKRKYAEIEEEQSRYRRGAFRKFKNKKKSK